MVSASSSVLTRDTSSKTAAAAATTATPTTVSSTTTSSSTTTTTSINNNMPFQSPIPLEPDEAENEAVLALARQLAPALEQQAVALLMDDDHDIDNHDDTGGLTRTRQVDQDDDLEEEMADLRASEDLLRQELEAATNFSAIFGFTTTVLSDDEDKQQDSDRFETPPRRTAPVLLEEEEPFQPTAPLPRHGMASTPEADVDWEQTELEDAPSPTQPIPLSPLASPTSMSGGTPSQTGASAVLVQLGGGRKYTEQDHAVQLGLQPGSQPPWSHSVTLDALVCHNHSCTTALPSIHEQLLSLSPTHLQRLYVGLVDDKHHDALPVRIVGFCVRPDVLCGAVMEGVAQALQEQEAVMVKRQGGHVQAIVPSVTVVHANNTSEEQHDSEDSLSTTAGIHTFPSYFCDAQLVTSNTDDCQRTLLLRIYHASAAANGDATALDDTALETPEPIEMGSPPDMQAAYQVREAAALLQRMNTLASQKKRIRLDTSTITTAASPGSEQGTATWPAALSQYLRTHYRACPSVTAGNVTLPSLNPQDFMVVAAASRLVSATWEELESRDLATSTLATLRFGSFPALPTVDVHACQQLRKLSRQAMIRQLLKSAQELEDYAVQAEYACANLIALLRPTYALYGVSPPPLPKPRALTDYPFQFQPPQASCPPWGSLVQHALDEVTAQSSRPSEHSEDSLDAAAAAVRKVFTAFGRQDDEEYSARLGRKNAQVMDRLAKMQQHELACIQRLEEASRLEGKAKKAAQHFMRKTGVQEVPLLKWSIVVGSATGSLTVSARHLVFSTQLIPVLGGTRSTVLELGELDYELQEGTTSLLNPLPTVIRIRKEGREVYSFRPSVSGARLVQCLQTIQRAAREEPLPWG